MVERISPEEFRAAPGVADWQAGPATATAVFATGSFAAGVRLVNEIAALADAANHHPDVDLRYAQVTVRLSTHEVGGLTGRDIALARGISAAARRLGFAPPGGASAP